MTSDEHPRAAGRRRSAPLRLVWHTLVHAWSGRVFGRGAEAAFWQTLSLPPLLLGLLGSLGFIAGWFGPDTIGLVEREILQFSSTVFTDNVVDQIIGPTVTDILTRGRSQIVSVGFVLSLWAGSSALASIIYGITSAYDQETVRHPVWQRVFALLTYVLSLIGAVVVLPVVAIGPSMLPSLFPDSIRPTVAGIVSVAYYPVLGVLLVLALATLYRVALPHKLPWHRGLPGALLAMVVFLAASGVLRFYITSVTATGYTYGALATPIAYLLFAFFIALAILFGAHFNHTIQQMWPARTTRRERRRLRRLIMMRIAARRRGENGAKGHAPPKDTSDAATASPTPRESTQQPAEPPADQPAQPSSSSPPEGSPSKMRLHSGQTGEPGLGDRVTGNTSPHSATT